MSRPERWAAIVPLVGGQVFGTEREMGTPPQEFISFKAFGGNEAFLFNYRDQIPRTILDNKENILHGGADRGYELMVTTCPCAGLSMMNTQKSDDPQRELKNEWMRRVATMVLRDIRPNILLGENAPQLATKMGASVRTQLEEIGLRHGYGLAVWKTNTVFAGIPQRRSRTFYAFIRDCWVDDRVLARIVRAERLPPPPTALTYLGNLAGLGLPDDAPDQIRLECDPLHVFAVARWGSRWRTGGGQNRAFISLWDMLVRSNEVENYSRMFPTEGSLEGMPQEIIDVLNPIERSTALAQIRLGHRSLKAFAEGRGVYHKTPALPGEGGVYNTVTGKIVERMVHPVEDRYLSIREVAHMMGLPADMRLPDWKNINVLCQNVPTNTAAIATRVALEAFRLGQPNRLGLTLFKGEEEVRGDRGSDLAEDEDALEEQDA